MSVTVRQNTGKSLSVSSGSQSGATIVVKRAPDLTIQSLTNVESTDLQDGYTLIYDAETNKFRTQPISNVTIQTLDGGTY